MLSEALESRATAYVTGALSAPERQGFEVLIEYDEELRKHVVRLQELAAELSRVPVCQAPAPSGGLKARILADLGPQPAKTPPDALVVTGPDRRILWVNDAFTGMCGYAPHELLGQVPGALLQGPDTDALALARIRAALAANRPCRERLINYHKDGPVYWVDVRIDPIPDDEGTPLFFVARERKLGDLPAQPLATA
ncbi:MAG: PAS domain-containing protein [Verrucomicrobiota bacterium]